MAKATSISTFERDTETSLWRTPSIEFTHDFSREWERENMVSAHATGLTESLLVSIDGNKNCMMARLSLEDALALRKELNKAIAIVRKELK